MENTREILAGVMSLASWKNLALLLAVINLKSLPFVWHVSVSFAPCSRIRIDFLPLISYTTNRLNSSACCITS